MDDTDLNELVLYHSILAFFPKPFGEFSEGFPLCGVHVDMFTMADILIVDNVIMNSFGSCRSKHRVSPNVPQLQSVMHDESELR